VEAVAARSLAKAQAHAKQHGIPKAYGSYDELVAQKDIDVVYIPLPIALHAKWAIKAMKSGKHVLIEKALCVNADEANAIRVCAEETGKVAMEAMHWQFHPAVHVVKAMVDSGKYGRLNSCEATLVLPECMFPADDIRFNYEMGGGASLDLSYVFSAMRYYVGTDGEYELLSANARKGKKDERVDEAMEAEYLYKPKQGGPDVQCRVHADLAKPNILKLFPSTMGSPRVTLKMERGTITFDNYVAPHYIHFIKIEDKRTGLTTTQKNYYFGPEWETTGDVWWSTYRYQLEAFVAKLKGETPKVWVEMDDTTAMMAMIDNVYVKAGMVKRATKVSI
jgi:predicted dehydrogenase